MKLKHLYSYNNKRQIWRIIPAGENRLVIEERDSSTREVFFSCIEMKTGKVILNKLQLEEKYWIGIEDVYQDLIYFHKYSKPDMPWHSEIMAYDMNNKKMLWHSKDYIFSLVLNDKLYCYKNNYEGRTYFCLHYKTGELIENLVNHPEEMAGLKEMRESEIYAEYNFPTVFSHSSGEIKALFDEIRTKEVITGKIDYLEFNGIILSSYHKALKDGKLQNCFNALDIRTKKIIFKKILNQETTNFIPDSFFLINNLVLMLREKEELCVYLITD
jgi:hypothetical protein